MFTLSAVADLPNLWIYPVDVIPKDSRRNHLILDFTWSAIDNTRERDSPAEEMNFGGALACSVRWVITAESALDTIYLIKVELDDVYMRLWVRVEDTQYTAFISPKCDY